MKTTLLLPNYFKKIGWILLVPSAILGLFIIIFDYEFGFLDTKVFTIYSGGFQEPVVFGMIKTNLTNTIVGVLFLIGAIFVAFSKEKKEDEYIAGIRLESLLWATYINYGVLLFCFIFFYAFEFLYVMIFNMFTILIFFIIRFYYMLYRSGKSLSHEKQAEN
jgi:small-conductance mechanosensitive channel